MKAMTVNGREIKTNFNKMCNFPVYNGYGGTTMTYNRIRSSETIEQMFNRLVEEGYTRITFYRMTTAVRGWNEIIAFCKK